MRVWTCFPTTTSICRDRPACYFAYTHTRPVLERTSAGGEVCVFAMESSHHATVNIAQYRMRLSQRCFNGFQHPVCFPFVLCMYVVCLPKTPGNIATVPSATSCVVVCVNALVVAGEFTFVDIQATCCSSVLAAEVCILQFTVSPFSILAPQRHEPTISSIPPSRDFTAAEGPSADLKTT